jgi:hypothetical protein
MLITRYCQKHFTGSCVGMPCKLIGASGVEPMAACTVAFRQVGNITKNAFSFER